MNATLDARKYSELLKDSLPLVIHTDTEHQRMLRTVETLMAKPDEETTAEEGRLLEMLAMLIEEYEDRVHPLPNTEPHKMLNYLLQEKGWKAADLADVLPKSRVSEILNGKRGISKAQATGRTVPRPGRTIPVKRASPGERHETLGYCTCNLRTEIRIETSKTAARR